MGGVSFRNKGSRRRGLTLYLSNLKFFQHVKTCNKTKICQVWNWDQVFFVINFLKYFLKNNFISKTVISKIWRNFRKY